MKSITVTVLIAWTFCRVVACCSVAISSDRNREAALRVKSVFDSVGIDFETLATDSNGEKEIFKTAVFRNRISCQVIHGGFEVSGLSIFAPLTIETISKVDKKAQVHLATLKPVSRYAMLNLTNPIVGDYTYIRSSNPKAFFETTITPVLANLDHIQAWDYEISSLDLIYNNAKEWEQFSENGRKMFCVEIFRKELKTTKGRTIPFRSLLVFAFDSPDRGVPSAAWITGEWRVGEKVCVIPKESCTPQWVFDDWKRHESGIVYPHRQVEANYTSDIGIPHLLNESSGWLTRLENGEFRPTLKPSTRREIVVKKWGPISPANLFLEPTDSVAVRDTDSNELYVEGKSKEESNKILGIVEPDDVEPPKRSFGRYMVFGAGATLAIVSFLILRRRQ